MSKPNKLQKPAQPSQKATSATVPPRPSAPKPRVAVVQNDTLVFGRANYMWMLIGIAVMAVGYVLMAGGGMSDPNTWDESVIYSPLRITVAPLLILIGLGIEVYAIFKKDTTLTTSQVESEQL